LSPLGILSDETQPFNRPQRKLIELNENNTIVLKGPINSAMLSNLIHNSGNIKSEDVVIYLSSPGGSVLSGNHFIEFIRALEHKGNKISCIADTAMSMAFVILQSCPTRYVLDSSIIMQHQMSLGLKGPLEHIKSRLEMINDLDEQLDRMQAKRLGLTVDEFRKKTVSDWWLYGPSIILNNAADEIVNVYCSDHLLGDRNTEKVVLTTFFGNFELIYSKCPLAREPLEIKMLDETAEKNKDIILELFSVDNLLNNYEKYKLNLERFIQLN
jgi:ATP-dependent Clp protease protease subunit